MCIISGKIEKVSNTEILAANIGNNKQLTVYSNKVQTHIPVAMILPYPKSKTPIQVIQTNPLDNQIFRDLNACFPSGWGVKTLGVSAGKSRSATTDYLPVLRSGSYQYSLADTTQDLNRVNPIVFRISGQLQTLLQKYENSHFAFIVCIIDSNVNYSPFAYITGMVNSQIFVPTKHYHEHGETSFGLDANLLSNVYRLSSQSITGTERGTEDDYSNDWDHSIFLLNTSESGNAFQGFANNKRYSFAEYLSQYPADKMHRMTMEGRHPNKDLIVSVA